MLDRCVGDYALASGQRTPSFTKHCTHSPLVHQSIQMIIIVFICNPCQLTASTSVQAYKWVMTQKKQNCSEHILLELLFKFKSYSLKYIYMLRNLLLTLLLVSYPAAADPQVTQARIDPVKSDNQWTRVDKSVELTYTYNVVPDDRWHQFPDFAMSIDLLFSQYVRIEYNIQYWTQRVTRTYTRVLIDEVESQRVFRIAGGYTNFHSNQISREVWLQKGRHTVVVEYKTKELRDGGQPMKDWNVALFNIVYYQ